MIKLTNRFPYISFFIIFSYLVRIYLKKKHKFLLCCKTDLSMQAQCVNYKNKNVWKQIYPDKDCRVDEEGTHGATSQCRRRDCVSSSASCVRRAPPPPPPPPSSCPSCSVASPPTPAWGLHFSCSFITTYGSNTWMVNKRPTWKPGPNGLQSVRLLTLISELA